jgi:hypothetical protein
MLILQFKGLILSLSQCVITIYLYVFVFFQQAIFGPYHLLNGLESLWLLVEYLNLKLLLKVVNISSLLAISKLGDVADSIVVSLLQRVYFSNEVIDCRYIDIKHSLNS